MESKYGGWWFGGRAEHYKMVTVFGPITVEKTLHYDKKKLEGFFSVVQFIISRGGREL